MSTLVRCLKVGSSLLQQRRGFSPKAIAQYSSSDAAKSGSSDDPPVPSNSRLPKPPPAKYVNTQEHTARIGQPIPEDLPEELLTYRYPQFFIPPDPFKRTARALRNDMDLMKKGRLLRREDEVFPAFVDIAIFGGGIMGSSAAYWLKQRAPESFSMVVIERDPQYTHASTTLSVGGIRQQFSLPENIEMSMFSADFLRNLKRHLSVLDNEPPDLHFCPHGYLFLASENGADQLLDNHQVQTGLGAFVDVLNKSQLKERYPWLNTDGLILGAHGAQNEGWFDPWTLLVAFKAKAEFLGAEYLEAEILDFNIQAKLASLGMKDDTGKRLETCNHVIVRLPNGEERQIQFAYGIVTAGAQSGDIARMMKIGTVDHGVRRFPCPIEPRKRYVYVFHCPDGPGLDFPLLVDPSGVYCRREGLGGNFIAGKSPEPHEEPDVSNFDVDYSYFESHIWPVLAHRVKAFEKIKLIGAWSGYYDYNSFDQNAIIGNHPYYPNIYWATGFSGHGIQMAPAVGRAIMERILDHGYQTIDLTRFGWERIFEGIPVKERNIV